MKRILPGLVLAGCWLALLLYGHFYIFWPVVILVALLSGHEYLKMTLREYLLESERVLLTCVITLPVFLAGVWHETGLSGGVFFSVFLSLCYILSNYSRLKDSFTVLCRLIFGAVYIGFLVAHLVLLWFLPEGNYWLIILVAITAGSDSGAYYCGKKFGRKKLCPHVSPNKTVEGAVGGLAAGLFAALVLAWMLLDAVNWTVLIPMAILLTGMGILGDLCESIIKRGTNTKDSGTILLGHGGVLDRVDSMILAAPLLYYLLVFSS